MPETPQEWYARVHDAVDREGYRESDWSQWRTWPFDGTLVARDLHPPAEAEEPRHGAGGVDCAQCEASRTDDGSSVFWRDDLMMLGRPLEGSSLPFAAFLMPRRHADLRDLTEAEAARSGVLLSAIERAACDVLDVPRIQAARWGDGSEHLHWWLSARPTGALQLRGTFMSHWEELLPVRDAAAVNADLDLIASRLAALVGGVALPTPPD